MRTRERGPPSEIYFHFSLSKIVKIFVVPVPLLTLFSSSKRDESDSEVRILNMFRNISLL